LDKVVVARHSARPPLANDCFLVHHDGAQASTRMPKQKSAGTSPARIRGNTLSAAIPAGYADLLRSLKARVRAAQLRAAVSVNRQLIQLYWDIGKAIVEAQKVKGYGKQVVERLAGDLQKEFPGLAGFSPQNVWYMRSFYLAWTDMVQKLQQPVGESALGILPQPVGDFPPMPMAEIPWGHNLVLLAKLESPLIRLWYAHKVIS
jgi:predicted nuclease of restriction endonuclease-like (RecB) superfamily